MPAGRLTRVHRGTRMGKATRTIAKKALRIAKRNIVTEFTETNQVTEDLTGSSVPDITYLQPATTDGDRQTLINLNGRIEMRQDLMSQLSDNYRIDIVLDRRPSGVIIDPAILYGDATPRITALVDFNLRGRFKILRSFQGVFEQSTVTNRIFKFNIPLNLVVESNAEAPSQGEVQKNAIYLIVWTTATANFPSITRDFRLISKTQ